VKSSFKEAEMGFESTKEDKDHVLKLFPEVEWISDDAIREGVISAWVGAWRVGGWDRLENAPLMIKEIRDPKVGVLHVRVSAQLTVAIADIVEREMGQKLNRDHLIAGALLHDVGKPLEYAPHGQGRLGGDQLRHPVSGAHLVLEAGLPLEIAHIVATHSEEGTLYEKSLEAEIVTRAELLAWEVTCRQTFGVPSSRYGEKQVEAKD
jgi:putative nucleotidyltransferase with HDIG domain